METAVFGGGCFWCTEAIFQRLRGVQTVKPGYAGGHVKNPSYEEVCSGTTGHAEVIHIEFDPKQISYEALLDVFMHTHDPTTLNRQGNDVGEQYRSVIFYTNDLQKKTAEQYIEKLNNAEEFPNPVITQLEALDNFYEAESYHQDYFNKNSYQPYCSVIIAPKVKKFFEKYGKMVKEEK